MGDDEIDEFRHLIIGAQVDAQKRGVLLMWTIYCKPKDFPDNYVARLSEIDKGKTTITQTAVQTDATHGGLEVLRGLFLASGLTCLQRMPGDHPTVVEVWL